MTSGEPYVDERTNEINLYFFHTPKFNQKIYNLSHQHHYHHHHLIIARINFFDDLCAT